MLSTAQLSTEKVLSLKLVPPERQRFAARQDGVAAMRPCISYQITGSMEWKVRMHSSLLKRGGGGGWYS